MVESFLELVLGNLLETSILLVVGLFLGILFSHLYWTRQVRKRKKQIRTRESRIKDLETSVEEKDVDMKEMRVRAQVALNKHQKEIESLNTQLKDNEFLLNAKENGLESLNTQLGQRDEGIRNLTQQISEKDESISFLKKEVADLKIKNRESVNRAASSEDSVGDLEESLKEMKQVFSSQKARMRAMQDDLTYIVGIGPKVSSILRSAGINTFAKLGSADVNRIREVLETKNPNILRLIDPSTWPKQARMASEENWEALSSLQDRLKESRRV